MTPELTDTQLWLLRRFASRNITILTCSDKAISGIALGLLHLGLIEQTNYYQVQNEKDCARTFRLTHKGERILEERRSK